MSADTDLGPDAVRALKDAVRSRVADCEHLQDAAQRFSETIYDAFPRRLALVRVFMNLPWRALPAVERTAVEETLSTARPGTRLTDDSDVLVLLGTRGIEPEWNERTRSRSHRAIPLLSPDYVEQAPMIAQLLAQIGLSVEGLRPGDSRMVTRSPASLSSVFHVGDAEGARDEQGRHIISGRNFVTRYGIRSAFGCGGAYAMRQVVVLVAFSTEPVDRPLAESFAPVMSAFRTATMEHALIGRYFS